MLECSLFYIPAIRGKDFLVPVKTSVFFFTHGGRKRASSPSKIIEMMTNCQGFAKRVIIILRLALLV